MHLYYYCSLWDRVDDVLGPFSAKTSCGIVFQAKCVFCDLSKANAFLKLATFFAAGKSVESAAKHVFINNGYGSYKFNFTKLAVRSCSSG